MAKSVVVFGTGSFAECVNFYLTHDSPHEVVAFTVHGTVGEQTELAGLPVVAFEASRETHAGRVRHVHRRRLREGQPCPRRDLRGGQGQGLQPHQLRELRRPRLGRDTKIGDNVFIFEDNTIQPFVKIGDDTVLWSGNHIGHHAAIGPHCFITSHVVISGHVTVGAYCFIGVNATVRDAIAIGEANIIGSAALIMKTTKDNEVYIAPRTKPDARTSDQIGCDGARGPELSDALAGVAALYTANLAEHGTSSASVGWPDPDAQRLRFDKLAYVIDADRPRGRSPPTTWAAGTAPCSGTSTIGSRSVATPPTTSAWRCSTRREGSSTTRGRGGPQGAEVTETADSFVSGTFNVRMEARRRGLAPLRRGHAEAAGSAVAPRLRVQPADHLRGLAEGQPVLRRPRSFLHFCRESSPAT